MVTGGAPASISSEFPGEGDVGEYPMCIVPASGVVSGERGMLGAMYTFATMGV